MNSEKDAVENTRKADTADAADTETTEITEESSLKHYQTIITQRAEEQIGKYLEYLVMKKMNMQAAVAVSDDYDETVDRLEYLAGSFRVSDDEDLKKRGIRKIFMERHNYVLMAHIRYCYVVV